MPNVEFYVKLKIGEGRMSGFKQNVDAIVANAKTMGEAVLRCDWFIHEGKSESVSMTVFADEAAMQKHFASVGKNYDAIAACASGNLQFLGNVSATTKSLVAKFNPRVLQFAYGIKPASTTIHAALGINGKRGIEIYTRFDIFPEHLEGCKQVGADLIPIVSSKDPGTTRYDWFYDDEQRIGVAMDAYADTPSMFAHMKNAHDVHELLFDHCTMVTEFLGGLPAEAEAAVARYNPYILPLYAGL